jgi:hypothetical protein
MITEKYAEERGYTYHGAYSWNQEEMKKRAAELRKEGNKAMVVYSPASPLSRSSSGGGYSVYWIESEENRRARHLKEANGLAWRAQSKISRLINELAEANKELEAAQARVKELTEGVQS